MHSERISEFDIAVKLFKQRKYREAEKILLQILKNNRKDKYALFQMGKIKIRLRDNKGAEQYFKECLKYFPQNKYPVLELGKLYSKQGKEKEAEEQFKKYIEIDQDRTPHARLELGKLYATQGKEKEAEEQFKKYIQIDQDRNPHARLQLGKLYATQGKEKEAEEQFKKYIEIDQDRTPHARLQLGKLYATQGKEKEAEEQFKKYIEIDQDRSPHARLELGKLYATQGKDKDAQKMYEYILRNIDSEMYDVETRITHMQKHIKNNLSKPIHGVWKKDCVELLNEAIKNKGKKQIGYMCDIYCINVPECGYEGGKEGDGHILNYITLITLPNTDTLITMFPSDEIIINKNKNIEENGGGHDEK